MPPRATAIAYRTEESVATLALAGIMVLPLAEIAVRAIWSEGIRGAAPIAQNLTVWVGLLGAAIAAREGKLLTLATGEFLPKGAVTKFAPSHARPTPRRPRRLQRRALRSSVPRSRTQPL